MKPMTGTGMADRWLTRRQVGGAFLGAALAAGLAGCSTVLGDGEPSLFRLTPVREFSPALPRATWQLQIDPPVAAAGIDTSRIALRDTPTNLDYFAGVSWTDRAPLMVQGVIVESFENSGMIVAVGRNTVGLRPDVVLNTELRDFQAEYTGNRSSPPQAHVRLSVKLVAMPRRTIEASATFEAVVPATSVRFEDIIVAWDRAMSQVLRQTVEWTLTRSALSSAGAAGAAGAARRTEP